MSVNAEKFIKDDDLKLELVAEDLKTPISMGFLGHNDLLVLEKKGKVQRVIDKKVLPSPILDITQIVKSEVERGLLGIAISEENGNDKDNIYNKDFNIYLLYTENTINSEAVNNHCKSEKCKIKDRGAIQQYMNDYNKRLLKDGVVKSLYKYKFKDNKLVNPELLLRTPVDRSSSSILHIGGAITIGPDNKIYITSGDGTICFNSEECEILLKEGPLRSQTANFGNGIRPIGSGGILYINMNDKMTNYDGILGNEIPLNVYYAYGIRNSFGIDFDPVTGYLWDTENGPAFGDEINLVKPGFNSGWAKKQGVWPIVNPSQLAPDPLPGKERGYDFSSNPQKENEYESFVDFNGKGKYSDPEFTWNDPVGVTSMEFFNSDKLGKEYENDMFVATFNGGIIYNFDLNKDRNTLALKGVLQDKVADTNQELQDVIFGKIESSITDLETGPDGYLYVLAQGEGKIWRIVPNLDALFSKGLALDKLGQDQDAITWYDKVLKINPNDIEVLYNKAIALNNLGQNEDSLMLYDKILEIQPNTTDATYNKGLIYYNLGLYQYAIEWYDKALAIDPNYVDALFNKGVILDRLGKYHDSIIMYDKVLGIQPNATDALNNKGYALNNLSQYQEAIIWYDKALAIDPNYVDSLNGKAFALANLDKNEEALPISERALELKPDNENYLQTAAFIMYNLGKDDQAKNYYNRALYIDPNLKDRLSEAELNAFNSVMK